MAEGFMPVGAKQSGTRDAGKADFTKHLIRLRRVDDGKVYNVGDTVCEILLKNANDGTSAYDLMAGLFRIRCMNSLVAQTGTIDSVKVRHSGDVGAKVIEGTYRVLNEVEKTLAAPADWGSLGLNKDERMIFAESAHIIRFGDTTSEHRSNRNNCSSPAAMTTSPTTFGQRSTWHRKTSSKAVCAV
jgi:hypothetical protein